MFCFSKKVRSDFFKMMQGFPLPGSDFIILLALSGGADSSALFSLLYGNREKYGYSLCALHVNHMIRAIEADRDEEFCKKLCEKYDVRFFDIKEDIPKTARRLGKGLEECARDFRYKCFSDCAQKLEKDTGKKVYIATAHNADDNIETVLFNLTRGTSLTGLGGIKPMRENIIRPLLLSTKDEILGYCKENGTEYIIDSTNASVDYTRNRLRHLVVPELKKINPSLASAITRMSASVSLDDLYLDAVADGFLKQSTQKHALVLDKLNALHPAVKNRVIRLFLLSNGVKEPSDVHINNVAESACKQIPHSSIDLPGKKSVKIEADMLTITATSRDKKNTSFNYKLELAVPVITDNGDVVARFDGSDKENIEKFQNIYKIFIQTPIKSAKIVGNVFVRTRLPGDTVNINGVNKKLKKLLWEIEPSPEKRDTLPIFTDDSGILWVPGARSRSESFAKADEKFEIFIYVKAK